MPKNLSRISAALLRSAISWPPGGRRRRHRGDVRRQPRDAPGPGRHPSLTPAECFEQYAGDLVRELGGSADRALGAARAVITESAGKAGYPTLWRQAALAVELCQRAAEITGPELPGSYRPGSQAGSGIRR